MVLPSDINEMLLFLGVFCVLNEQPVFSSKSFNKEVLIKTELENIYKDVRGAKTSVEI